MRRENFGTGILKKFFMSMAVIGSAIAISKENENWQSGVIGHNVQNDVITLGDDVVDLGVMIGDDGDLNDDIKEDRAVEAETGEVKGEVSLSNPSSGNDISPLYGGFDPKSKNPLESIAMKQIIRGGVFAPRDSSIAEHIEPDYRTASGQVKSSAIAKIDVTHNMNIDFNDIENFPEENSSIEILMNNNRNYIVNMNFPVDGDLVETSGGLKFLLNDGTTINPLVVDLKGKAGKSESELRIMAREADTKNFRHVEPKELTLGLPEHFDKKAVVDKHGIKRRDHRNELVEQRTKQYGDRPQRHATLTGDDKFKGDISYITSSSQGGVSSASSVVSTMFTVSAIVSICFRDRVVPINGNIRIRGVDKSLIPAIAEQHNRR